MNVLITGGAGFIGSFLSERLLSLGYSVTAVDNFNSYYNPQYKRENIQPFLSYRNYAILEGDIIDDDFLKNVFDKYKFDKVIHLAASVGVRNSLLQPQDYYLNNVHGTQALLEEVVQHNVSQFIFASSSSVYGNNSSTPFQEDAVVDSPLTPYAQTKKEAEKLCKTYHKKSGIPMTVLRFFTVYGPKGRPDMSPYIFADAILKRKKITIFGDGSARRDFTYVGDIVEGIIRVMQKEFVFETFNLGSSSSIDILSSIHTIEQLTHTKATVEFAPRISSEMQNTYANIQKAEKLLGYTPKTRIAEGLEVFIQWFKKNRK